MTEKQKLYYKKWCLKNKEHLREYRKKYLATYRKIPKNREKHRLTSREWARKNRIANPEKVRESQIRYRLLNRNTVTKRTPKLGLRFSIFLRDNFTCRYCGRNVKDDGVRLELDHFFPRSKGGKDTRENYLTSCRDCNIGKLNKIISPEAKI